MGDCSKRIISRPKPQDRMGCVVVGRTTCGKGNGSIKHTCALTVYQLGVTIEGVPCPESVVLGQECNMTITW
jgi:hypothetical protein